MLADTSLRLVIFLSAFGILCWAEIYFPKRSLRIAKWVRWRRNLSLITLANVISFVVLPFTALGAAWYGQTHQLGLLYLVDWPVELRILIAVLLLDLFIYAQHVAFHHIPIFWRFHKVHHMDQDIDVTTGIRFHPVEILLSIVLKVAAILVIGAPVLAVVMFELLLNVTALFSHSNLALSKTIDQILRWIMVTPDMHRIHHSSIQQEEQSNFGFNIPWWDRLFNTYQAQPKHGHKHMDIGLTQYYQVETTTLVTSLMAPFKRQ